MEPIGLALTRQPLNVAAIVFLVIIAVAVFVVAYRARAWDEEDEGEDEA